MVEMSFVNVFGSLFISLQDSQIKFAENKVVLWRLCAIKPRLWLERFQPQVGLEPGTARPVGKGLTY